MDKNILKKELKQLLSEYHGDTKNTEVINVINKLSSFQQEKYQEDLLMGNWLLVSAPNFPQGEKLSDGKYSYSLGRLAFNMFQPTDLKLVINRVFQPVFPIKNTEEMTHDIVVEFTTIDPRYEDVKGIVRNLGVCENNDHSSIKVKFTGGVLEPQTGVNLNVWKSIFANQNLIVKQGFKDKLTALLLKFMFGLVPSTGIDEDNGNISFEMRRSPQGSLKILYLDEELRITQGEKGTILVCERIGVGGDDFSLLPNLKR